MSGDLPEFRVDAVTGRSVIVASARRDRPNARTPEPRLDQSRDPFLSGRESETPSERWAVREPGTVPDGPGWKLRIVPNRYPIVGEGTGDPNVRLDDAADLFPMAAASGVHDVVVECADGRTRLIELSEAELRQVLVSWQSRLREIAGDPSIQEAVIFRNEGFSAGASLAHCHSQIVGTRTALPGMQQRRLRARQYRVATGGDLLVDWLQGELSDGRRVVLRQHGLAVVCPFAPRSGYHLRIVPVALPCGPFTVADSAMIDGLARVLLTSLRGIDELLGEVSFNLLLVSDVRRGEDELHWMMELVPRMTRVAGWELLTDVDVVTVSPESAAEALRAVM